MRAASVSAVCVVVAGCGVSAEPAPQPTSATASPAPALTSASPTPTVPVLFPNGQECYGKGNNFYDSYMRAWKDKRDFCDTTDYDALYVPTAKEEKALYAAYGRKSDGVEDLVILYDLCAQSGTKAWSTSAMPYSRQQIREVRAALMLCPNHPDRELIEQGMGQGLQEEKWEKQGRLFSSGTFRVGKQIQPGTYVSAGAEGCYWERTDSNGTPIANNFTMGKTRVQVTIYASDYSFTSQDCGVWKPAA